MNEPDDYALWKAWWYEALLYRATPEHRMRALDKLRGLRGLSTKRDG